MIGLVGVARRERVNLSEHVGSGPPTEPCACGGVIVSVTRLVVDVAAAIKAHQQMKQHKAWRARTFGDRGVG